MSEINEQEKTNAACECCSGNAETKTVAAKKSSGNIVRVVIWSVVAVLICCFFVFKKDISQYIHNKRVIEHIYEKGAKELKLQLFKVEYIGDNKFKVTVKDPGKLSQEESKKYSRYNNIVFVCELNNGEAVLSFNGDDDIFWDFWRAQSKK